MEGGGRSWWGFRYNFNLLAQAGLILIEVRAVIVFVYSRTKLHLTLERPRVETFSTCSLIMSASFDVNWMTSSFIIYA